VVGVSDTRLRELSQEPPGRLLVVFDRASAMAPLVVLMAVLPGLTTLVLVPADLTPRAGVANVVSPWGEWLAAEIWRQGVDIQSLGTDWLPIVPSYVATVFLVAMAWHTARILFGPRTGLLTVMLLCCHTPVLILSRSIEPLALGVAVTAWTVTAFVTHLQRPHGLVSGPLLLSICGLVITVFLSGGLAWPLLCLLLVAIFSNPAGELGLWGRSGVVARARVGGRWRGPLAWVALTVGLVMLVGLWSFWQGVGGLDPRIWSGAELGFSGMDDQASAGWPTLRLLALSWGWLAGPIVLGLADTVGRLRGVGRSTRPVALLLVAWWVFGIISTALAAEGYPLRSATASLLIPTGMLAARGIESLCDRRWGVTAAVAATILSGCLGADVVREQAAEWWWGSPWQQWAQASGVACAVAVTIGMSMSVSCGRKERYQRGVLLACVLLLVTAQLVNGWLDVPVAVVGAMGTQNL